MAYLDADHRKWLEGMANARMNRANATGTGPSSIKRQSKRDKRESKAANRLKNLANRRNAK